MSSSYNRVTIMGNLAAAPDLRYLPGGDKTAIVEVAVAVNERFKKDGEYVESVSFVDCSFFARTAEVVNEFLKKGDPILVEGRLKQDRWKHKETDQNRSKLKVVVEQMKMIGSKRADDDPAQAEEVPVGAGADSDQAPY